MRHKQLGFTLMEVTVGIALLGILSVGGMLAYRQQIAKARDARRKSDLVRLAHALSDFFNDFQVYPNTPVVTTCNGTGLSPYLQYVPCDPINSGGYIYTYVTNAVRNYFKLSAKMEFDSIGTYIITSDGAAGASGGNEEGVPPTCGSGTKYCFPNICSSCCPGSNYRCSASGQRCVVDTTCQ